jgi:hypothetical protein
VITVRLATPDDVDAIYAFWETLDEAPRPFKCAPGRHHASRERLGQWLTGERSIALVEDDGEIVLADVFNLETAESDWTSTSRERFAEVVPVVFRWEKEQTGQNAWGYCGFVPVVAMYVAAGWRDRGDGMIEWAGP